ncbi:uncharacterized protein RAG0_09031 [Rhynchosporium agropyri]|uniref:Uncharacterized protein n=1 Tax=Rhynchosporium agropyri TaxID=914238 RepID=A0A1E1KTJ9_9HELO|nr:uncharacterized protein RAG0_09031 [Rhynchosporium agropyri]
MMYSALLVVATAAFASAQVTYDDKTGKFICPADKPNGAFCAGDSLGTNIIIRCTNGIGQPGNCNDNLAGYFPFGVRSSQCWQSTPTSGIAACAKNCIVQGGSGTYNGTFTLPNCTPIVQSSTTSPGYPTGPTTTITYINPGPPTSTLEPTITKTFVNPIPTYTPHPSLNGTTTITETGTTTTTCVTDGTTTTSTITYTTTYCPTTTGSTLSTIKSTYAQPSGTGSGHSNSGTNGTNPTYTHGPATATPVGPPASSTSGPVLSNNAVVNSGTAGAGLAAVGLLIAYFL